MPPPKYVFVQTYTRSCQGSDSPALTYAQDLCKPQGRHRRWGEGTDGRGSSCLGWVLGTLEPQEGASAHSQTLWFGPEKALSCDGFWQWGPSREQWAGVSELCGRLCVRNGAWQPLRGLCQTSSSSLLPAGPGQGAAGPGLPTSPQAWLPFSLLQELNRGGEGSRAGVALGAGFTGQPGGEGAPLKGGWEQPVGPVPGKP